MMKLMFQNPENAGPIPHPVFWLEALTIEAFGVSWIVKGAAILKDLPRVDEQDAHT